jgi:phosphoribosylformimino-5-aminoimidazole carboxamide ribonucleotide (ProFAR) isomerase
VKIHAIASGGVATLDDIRRVKELQSDGVEGVIVGRALYSGAFTLREAASVVA